MYGTINSTDYRVWVNGRLASVAGGEWSVDAVPVTPGGTAVVQARAIPVSDNGGNGTGGSGGSSSSMEDLGNPASTLAVDREAWKDKPAEVVIIHYDKMLELHRDRMDGDNPPHETTTEDILWEPNKPGHWYWDLCSEDNTRQNYDWFDADWEQDGWGTAAANEGGPCGIKEPLSVDPYEAPNYWPAERCGLMEERYTADQFHTDHSTIARTATTRYELRTGGKAVLRRVNLFQLTASASGVGNPFYPELDAEPYAYPIDSTSIRLGSLGTLGADGKLYKVLPDSTTHDITPTVVQSPYYTYGAPGQQKHRLRISANGSPLAHDRVVPAGQYIVGQDLNFTAYFTPSLTDTRSELVKWTFEGNFFNDQTNVVPGRIMPISADVPFVNADLLTYDSLSLSTTAWWVSGGFNPATTYSARVGVHLTFNNGQQVATVAKGLFHMYRPQASISTSTTAAGVSANTLYFGVPPNNGITFAGTLSIPAGFSGAKRWVQVANGWSRALVENNSQGHSAVHGPGGGPYLEGSYPWASFDAAGNAVFSPQHGPWSPSVYQLAQAADTYTMWLMFQPTGGHSVPLRAVNWSWSGTMTVPPPAPPAWVLTASGTWVNPSDYETEQYPVWYDIVENYYWSPPLP